MAGPTTVTSAESLLGSLCREADTCRLRSRQLLHCLRRCQDENLFVRLRRELDHLHRRRRDLLSAARSWQRRGVGDPLALAFLVELCSRPLT
ncbi:MAG: hypothetical protein EA413_04840 [Cyanobium sp. PLM2.Bin73]|jgi:hypothetical protein|nr:MAG: hypothetical protein EA413_04840 [Cyanobium sp. PLM2.Bin73]